MNATLPAAAWAYARHRTDFEPTPEAPTWTDAAAPTIRAVIAMQSARDALFAHDDGLSREARRVIGETIERLLGELDTARDEAVGARQPRVLHDDADEIAWTAWEETCAEIDRTVETVDAAVRRIGREDMQ